MAEYLEILQWLLYNTVIPLMPIPLVWLGAWLIGIDQKLLSIFLMNEKTKEERKKINQKIIDAAFGATSGAAIGAGVGAASAVAVGATAGSVIPVVGTVAVGLAGLVAASAITRRRNEKLEDDSENDLCKG